MDINNFVTWDYISSYVGTIVVTMLIVQFLKELPYIKVIPTKYFTFLVAFLTIVICGLQAGTLSLSNLFLMFINAILVTLTATGGYDFAIKKVTVNEDKEVA